MNENANRNTDPRKITPPSRGDVLKCTRTEKERLVIYADEFTVILRCEELDRKKERHVQNYPSRDVFESKVEIGRLEYKPEAETSIPLGNPTHRSSKAKKSDQPSHNKDSSKQPDRPSESNRRASNDDEPKSASLTDFTEQYKNQTQREVQTEASSENGIELTDWTEVNGIGEKNNDNLHKEGYRTRKDISQASREDLTEVKGIGKKAADNLKKAVRIDWTEVKNVGEKTANKLYNSGFETEYDMQEVDVEKIAEFDMIGKSKAENIIELSKGK